MNDKGVRVEILVNDQIRLSEYRFSDKIALVEYLNDKDIYELTLRIPYPYTEAHAEDWLALFVKNTEQQGRPVNWAIRNADDRLIGGLSFQDFEVGKSHRAELGYWLAKPFWGRGIMTEVVRRLCRHAFEELGLVKVSALVFIENTASARVLEKCNFKLEGVLRKHHLKDGKFLDAKLFALVK